MPERRHFGAFAVEQQGTVPGQDARETNRATMEIHAGRLLGCSVLPTQLDN